MGRRSQAQLAKTSQRWLCAANVEGTIGCVILYPGDKMSEPSWYAGQNAAEDLEGKRLPGGWLVTSKFIQYPEDTGGHFSINYWVEDANGRKGFCKVLNYAWLLEATRHSGDPLDAMNDATAVYRFERDLARACVGLSRVVTALDDGHVVFREYAQPTVSYIIFETADCDIRRLLNTSDQLDVALRLRCLHHLATGIRQLHSRGVAHQDIKPSNTLVFPQDEYGLRITKIADLGRASVPGRSMQHDEFHVAGDHQYGPPEGLYREVPEDFAPRRWGCDLYQLGSMICFVFTSVPFNSLLKKELHPAHHWGTWGGSYTDVLPYVQDAFGRALGSIAASTPQHIRDRVVRLIEQLCNPDPFRRGHDRTRSQPGNPYDLQRVVTELDLLVRHAQIQLRHTL